MKSLFLINRFQPAKDGWFLLVPKGEHPWMSEDGSERMIQVVDDAAVESMVNRFKQAGAELMVDADHLSHDRTQKSEAYGWIDQVENREGNVWAHAGWTDIGEPAVKSRRYRFISPVFPRSGVQDLGNGRVRVLELSDAGLTNQSNMPVPPLTNRAEMDAWLKNAGTSEGAAKGWATRRGGGGGAAKAAKGTKGGKTGGKKAAKKKAPSEKEIAMQMVDGSTTRSEAIKSLTAPRAAKKGVSEKFQAETKAMLKESAKRSKGVSKKMPKPTTKDLEKLGKASGSAKAARARLKAAKSTASPEPEMSLSDFYATSAYGHRAARKSRNAYFGNAATTK